MSAAFYFLGFASFFLVLGITLGRRISDASHSIDRMTEAFGRDQDVLDEADFGEVR